MPLTFKSVRIRCKWTISGGTGASICRTIGIFTSTDDLSTALCGTCCVRERVPAIPQLTYTQIQIQIIILFWFNGNRIFHFFLHDDECSSILPTTQATSNSLHYFRNKTKITFIKHTVLISIVFSAKAFQHLYSRRWGRPACFACTCTTNYLLSIYGWRHRLLIF